MPTLTDKQRDFVEEYVADPNASRAALAAGYKNETYGRELLTKPHIEQAIKKGRAERRRQFIEESTLPISPKLKSALIDRFGTTREASKAVEKVVLALIEDQKDYVLKRRRKVGGDKRYDVLCRAGFRCQACGASPSDAEDVRLEVDHIVPVSWGGGNDMDNLQVLCRECNASKSDRYAYDHNNDQIRIPFNEYIE